MHQERRDAHPGSPAEAHHSNGPRDEQNRSSYVAYLSLHLRNICWFVSRVVRGRWQLMEDWTRSSRQLGLARRSNSDPRWTGRAWATFPLERSGLENASVEPCVSPVTSVAMDVMIICAHAAEYTETNISVAPRLFDDWRCGMQRLGAGQAMPWDD